MQTSFILVISFVFCLHGLLMNFRRNFRGQSNFWIILLIVYLRVVAAKKKAVLETKRWKQRMFDSKLLLFLRPKLFVFAD